MKCPCYTECTDCVPGFLKIIDLKNAGLVIYRRTVETEDVNKNTGNIDHAVNTTEDVYILHNTNDTDISSADYWPEIGNNTINCPRCRKLLEHAQTLLKTGPTISANDVTGICEYCKMKDKPCFKCRQVVKRFVPSKPDRTDIKKERVKHWLTKIGYLLQNINKITDEKQRSHSDTHIDQICNDRRRSERKPDVEQLIQPLELDLAAISQPHINGRIKGQNKDKRPVAHFPQLEKLETSIVFKDPLRRVVPPTSAPFKDDETFDERSNFNVRRILKPERKILASKYTTSPVRINSSETVSDEKSVVSFVQVFKDTISDTDTQQGAKTSRHVTQIDEMISFKPLETKHGPKIVISEKNEERPTRRKRARSVQPLEKKKDDLLDTKAKESERAALLRKYHSAETLVIKIHGITKYDIKQANRIIFPRQQSNVPTSQKSSSELIKDTKDKLTRAEEEKKLKKIFYEQTGQQRDEKETARQKSEKAIDHQESAVDDKQNARQEDKHSVKSDEKDELRTEEEVHKTRKDSQKSQKDTTDIIKDAQFAEKDVLTPKDSQKAAKDGYKTEIGARKKTKDAQFAEKDVLENEKDAQKTSRGTQKAERSDYKSEKDIQKAPKDARKSERDGYKSEKDAQKATKAETDDYTHEKGNKKTTKDAQKVKDGYKFEKEAHKAVKGSNKSEKGTQKTAEDAQKAEKDGYKSQKGTRKYTKDAQVAEKYAHKFDKDAQTTPKDAQKAVKDVYAFEKGDKKSTKDTLKAEKGGYTFEKGTQHTPKDSQKAAKDGYKTEIGARKKTKDAQFAEKDVLTPKDSQKAAKDGYKTEIGARKKTKDAQFAEKDVLENEKDAQKTSRGTQKAERSRYKSEKGGKEPTSDAQIAVKNTHKFEKGAQKTPTDVQKAKIEAEISSQKENKHAQKADLRGQKTTKDFLKSLKDAQIDMTPKNGKKLQKEDQNTEIISKKNAREAADRGFENQSGLKLNKKTQTSDRKTKSESELKNIRDQEPKLKAKKEKAELTKKKLEGDQNTEILAISMQAADLGFEKELGLNLKQKTQALQKNTKTELPLSEFKKTNNPNQEPKYMVENEQEEVIKKNYVGDQYTELHAKKIVMKAADLGFETKLGVKLKQKSQALEKITKTELPTSKKKKVDAGQIKLEPEIKLNAEVRRRRLGAQPIAHDLLDMKSIKIKQFDNEDLILKLVQMKKSIGDGVRIRDKQQDMRLPGKESEIPKKNLIVYPPQSETCLLSTDVSEIDEMKTTDVIIGSQICKITPLKLHDDSEVMPPLLKSGYDSIRIDKKQEIAQTPETSETEEYTIKPSKNEKQQTVVSTDTPRTKEAMKPRPLLSPGSVAAGATSKGYVRYTLSDRKFIENGWTLLPTEKVVRKMNVYRMRPAHPEFDWFEHNKNKRRMEYDTGEKLAEFDESGRGRWFYRNGRMALDYYDAEELNAGQRFVIYSNGEPDERGRSRPYTLLATFDFLGNGIVFDHRGKIRLKYNQTEGVVLDRSIGPVSHWKWHTLNDPPVLQQVMIDTQIAHKDPKIMKMGGASDNKPRKDNEEMLAIEFDNFIKEKSKKLSQAFKPFQIKMKALKINEHFSLRVLDQATVYLLYRDGTTNLKLNIGMVLDQKEIVDTDTAEVGEVSSSMEKLPARTESLASLQRSVAHAQHYDWKRTERERKMHPAEPSASVDKLLAGTSRPLRPPPRPVLSQSTSATTTECKCSRKPTSTSVYYDTRFY